MDKDNKTLRKNYSFYMPEDFAEKIDKLISSNETLKNLSRSQAVYFIISQMVEGLE